MIGRALQDPGGLRPVAAPVERRCDGIEPAAPAGEPAVEEAAQDTATKDSPPRTAPAADGLLPVPDENRLTAEGIVHDPGELLPVADKRILVLGDMLPADRCLPTNEDCLPVLEECLPALDEDMEDEGFEDGIPEDRDRGSGGFSSRGLVEAGWGSKRGSKGILLCDFPYLDDKSRVGKVARTEDRARKRLYQQGKGIRGGILLSVQNSLDYCSANFWALQILV